MIPRIRDLLPMSLEQIQQEMDFTPSVIKMRKIKKIGITDEDLDLLKEKGWHIWYSRRLSRGNIVVGNQERGIWGPIKSRKELIAFLTHQEIK